MEIGTCQAPASGCCTILILIKIPNVHINNYYSSIIEGWIIILKELLPCFININKIKNELLNTCNNK